MLRYIALTLSVTLNAILFNHSLSAQTLYNVPAPQIQSDSHAVSDSWYYPAETQSSGTISAKPVTLTSSVSLTEAPAKAAEYAYGFAETGNYYRIPLAQPTRTTLLHEGKDMVFCGVTVNGTPYGAKYYYTSNNTLVYTDWITFDPDKGTTKTVAKFASDTPIILDMTWNPANDKVYALAVGNNATYPSLYLFDVRTTAMTKICDYELRFYSIAADLAGNLFTITTDGTLYVIQNPETGKAGIIGKASVDGAKYVSSMDMDWNTGTLYWAMTAADKVTYLISINPRTASAKNIGSIGTKAASKEIAGLTVEKFTPDPNAPAAASNVTFTPDGNKSTAIVSWTNPDRTMNGTTITGNLTVQLYVNGVLKKEFTDAVAGNRITESVSGLATGLNTVRIVTVNGSGEGQRTDKTAWIGNDTPMAPTNVKVSRVNANETLVTWEAPTAGRHDGYFDPSKVKYRVERISAEGDTTVMMKTYRDTSYTDTSIKEPGVYAYRIQALTSDYGDASESTYQPLGPALEIPYVCQFLNKTESQLWTRIDVGGEGNCWTEALLSGHIYNTPRQNKDADDWLISHAINLQADSTYYLYFEFYTGLGAQYPKVLEVTVGQTTNPADHKLMTTYRFAEKAVQQARVTIPISKTGEYHIGIHDVSPFTSSSLALDNIILTEKTTGYIAGTVTDTEGRPLEGVFVNVPGTNVNSTTATDGKYLLDYIPDGTYPVRATKRGWVDFNGSATATGRNTTILDISMSKLPIHSISGTITNTLGNKVQNATVTVHGYGDTIRTSTDEHGRFKVEQLPVHPNYKYHVNIRKIKYSILRDSLNLNSDVDTTYVISPVKNPPVNFKAVRDGNTINFTWEEPRETFRYDNGIVNTQCGTQVPNDYAVFGSVFREGARIKAIQWVTSDYLGPHMEMNLWIFAIDENGVPTSKVLWNAMHVPAKGDVVWNHYELPEPFDAPDGFFVGVSYSKGMASLAWDNGGDPEWPFVAGVNYQNLDFRTKSWTLADGTYNRRHHLLRVEGDEIIPSGTGYEYKYALWRTKGEDMLDPEKWEEITPAGGTDQCSATDNLSDVADGEYYYVLKTLYAGGSQSKPVYSDGFSAASSGIEEITAVHSLDISPNPASSTAFFTASCNSVEIFSLSGALVLHKQEPGMTQCDISSLHKGVYLARLQSHDNIKTVKLIVK